MGRGRDETLPVNWYNHFMPDELPPSSHESSSVLVVALVLFVLIMASLLIGALLIFGARPVGPLPTATPADARPTALRNRLAVIADNHLYTIAPDGSDRVELAQTGQVPTAAVIWSHDGQRLIFVATEGGQSRVNSARLDGQEARVLYEADQTHEPFFLYGSPDDQHVAFLASDPQEGMQLHLAETDHPNSARLAIAGQPNYASWSPDSQTLLVHIGGASAEAFVGTYALSATQPVTLETQPALFQAPVWSPTGEAQWLYARQSGTSGELVVDNGRTSRTLTEFDGGIGFGWSPDGQHVAYAVNTPTSFIYEGLTVIDLATSASHVYFKGDVLAFFWSPDGKQLAYLTGELVAPPPTGRAGGLAAPAPLIQRIAARAQQRTLQVTWHVIDLEHDRTIDLNTFEPTESFLYLVEYFDQFAQSVAVWSPDSRSLVYAGQPLIGERGVYVIKSDDATATPRFVGPGDYAIWSWH